MENDDFIEKMIQEEDLTDELVHLFKCTSKVERRCNDKRDEVVSGILKNKTSDEKSANLEKDDSESLKEEIPNFDIDECTETSKTPLQLVIKKIYKKIALIYHPDKNDTEIARDVFRSVVKAKNEQNLGKLLFIFKMTNADLVLSTTEKDVLRKEKQKLEKKLEILKSSIFYKWDDMDESFKQKCIDYFKNRYSL